MSDEQPTILVVDDTPANLKLASGLLKEHYRVKAANNGAKALQIAASDTPPDLILLDIMMPEMDGYEVCRRLKADPKTAGIPIIFLTAKAEVDDEAFGLELGAVDYITKPISPPIAMARIKTHIDLFLKRRALIQSQAMLAEELNEAADYVQGLLPKHLEGRVRTRYEFIPSTSLGGDGFGHHWLDENRLAIYLLDVCGHGVGAALLSITALNSLRSEGLSGVDFGAPAEVLGGLNTAFPMEEHNNKFFTMWYGVFDRANKTLRYASAGHPPGLLVTGDGALVELSTGNIAIGFMPDYPFTEAEVACDTPSKLYVYSDGVYEIEQEDGTVMSLAEFVALMARFNDIERHQAAEVLAHMRAAKVGEGAFDDDFSLLELHFKDE